jgi:hypothetical protein
MSQQQEEHWRQFHGTELGGFLTQIYGNKGAQSRVSYPIINKKNKSFEPTSSFVSSGNPSKDMRHVKEVKVIVPQFKKLSVGGKKSQVEYIPRRKSENIIKAEIDDIKIKSQYYRPPVSRLISSDAEKERYSQICAYKGGKGLPQELTQPVGEAPFELAQRLKETKRIDGVRSKRNPSRSITAQALSVEEELAQQIMIEIDERRKYVQEMRLLGSLSNVEERRLLDEIASRVAHLKSYDN